MTFFHRSDRTASSRGLTSGPSLRPRNRRRREGTALLVASAVVVATVVAATVVVGAAPAQAETYPSWSQVQNAVGNENAKKAEIGSIQKLIANLKADVVAKQKVAAQRGTELQKARSAFDDQEAKVQGLQAQADAADKVANASESRAGLLAAQLGRSGTTSISTDLLTDPGKAGNLLYQLGAMSKLTEQANGIYAEAVQKRGVARSLTAQAELAAGALSDLASKAQAALVSADAATEAAQASVATQKSNSDRLTAQLKSLQTTTVLTETAWNRGVIARREAAAKAAAIAAAKAAAAAKASGATGVANSQGWTRPAGGYITSGFGMRVDPVTGSYALHAGTDLGAACGSNIYAAHSGTVIYAGPYGGYGNFVLLDNGDNINTGYGHIVDGGIHVSVGQTVTVGQVIAQVGSTGWSTGCHLHFETRVGGVATNAVPFMAARGVTL